MPEAVSARQHILKNTSLLCLSIIFLPLNTLVVLLCFAYRRVRPYIFHTAHPIQYDGDKRTVLVSALSMGKGLALARAFYLAGHRVIGVDFDTVHFAHATVPSSGEFSNALSKYFTVTTPLDSKSQAKYAADMVKIIKREKIDLWVCVSSVASTVEDALLKSTIEKQTKCKVFQPDPKTCEILHDKHQFMNAVREAGLAVPVTVLAESHEDIFKVLREHPTMSFILKCVELDDVSRADMTQIPQPTPLATEQFIHSIDISPKKRWVVQQFISGSEYCTHAVVVRGQVKAFVACSSSEMLMQYEPLPANSALSRAMLAFTRRLIKTLEGGQLTGQVSFDFLVDKNSLRTAENASDITLYPIECNPRTHTAVILLTGQPMDLANAYLSLLETPGLPTSKASRRESNGHTYPVDEYDIAGVAHPNPNDFFNRFHWGGHDLVEDVAMPFLDMMQLKIGPWEFVRHSVRFFTMMVVWKDATFEIWDPMPWWWLYHVFYPWLLVTSLATGKRWSRINVSTTRVFESY